MPEWENWQRERTLIDGETMVGGAGARKGEEEEGGRVGGVFINTLSRAALLLFLPKDRAKTVPFCLLPLAQPRAKEQDTPLKKFEKR